MLLRTPDCFPFQPPERDDLRQSSQNTAVSSSKPHSSQNNSAVDSTTQIDVVDNSSDSKEIKEETDKKDTLYTWNSVSKARVPDSVSKTSAGNQSAATQNINNANCVSSSRPSSTNTPPSFRNTPPPPSPNIPLQYPSAYSPPQPPRPSSRNTPPFYTPVTCPSGPVYQNGEPPLVNFPSSAVGQQALMYGSYPDGQPHTLVNVMRVPPAHTLTNPTFQPYYQPDMSTTLSAYPTPQMWGSAQIPTGWQQLPGQLLPQNVTHPPPAPQTGLPSSAYIGPSLQYINLRPEIASSSVDPDKIKVIPNTPLGSPRIPSSPDVGIPPQIPASSSLDASISVQPKQKPTDLSSFSSSSLLDRNSSDTSSKGISSKPNAETLWNREVDDFLKKMNHEEHSEDSQSHHNVKDKLRATPQQSFHQQSQTNDCSEDPRQDRSEVNTAAGGQCLEDINSSSQVTMSCLR